MKCLVPYNNAVECLKEKSQSMDIEIRAYDHSKDYETLIEIIRSEGEEWKDYLSTKYRKVLEQSITYVAFYDNKLCGYSRSIDDSGMHIWVVDLLVDIKYRGHSIGKKLME